MRAMLPKLLGMLMTHADSPGPSRLAGRAAQEGRSDDTADVVRRRLEVYAEQTAPLLDVYRDRGLLRTVDGMGAVDEVTARLVDVVEGAHA